MHELSLAESLIELIEDEARKQGFGKVRKIWLEAGALSGVDPEALRFGFEVAAEGSCAEGAALEILRPPGEAWCFACNRTVTVAEYYDGCPHCRGHQLQVTGGQQFQLKELEVE
jgi:hydrogenase nickel incorporation protein HypA/HybF